MSNIQGIDDFNKALAELTGDMRRKVIKAALRAAARPFIDSMKAKSIVLKKPTKYRTPGLMREAVKAMNSKISTRRGTFGLFIKPRSPRGAKRGAKSKQDPFYYKFVAGGFHAVGGAGRVKGGRITRRLNLQKQREAGRIRWIPGNDYIGRAFRASGQQALIAFQKKIKQRIDLANRRK